MTRLTACKKLRNPLFQVQVIVQDEVTWVRLSEQDIDNFFGVWSTQQLANEELLDTFIIELSNRLETLHTSDMLGIRRAIDYRPGGWEYWSLGTPLPLVDFVDYELKEKVATFLQAEECDKR